MLYRLVKLLMTLATRIFYRRIHFLNNQHIPPRGPAILIANHPGSLMDAALLGLLVNRPIHFFARGDLFKRRLIHRVLNALHMHPIHHHQYNRSSLGVNDESFDIALKLLQKGELVLFFPEGFSHIEYFLLPFKKGTFRLAFQALNKNGHDSLPIVPVGFHYSHPTALFSTVWIKAGTPLDAVDFYTGDQFNSAQAIRTLTDAAFAAISELTIQVPASYSKDLFHLLVLLRTAGWYQLAAPDEQWGMEKSVSTNFETVQEKIIESFRLYSHLLQQQQLSAEMVISGTIQVSKKKRLIGSFLAIPGLLLHAPPLLTAKWIADSKVTRIDFYAWILVAAAAILDSSWILLIFLGLTIAHSLLAGLSFLLISIVLGWVTWKCAPFLLLLRQEQQLKKIPGSALRQIRDKRETLIASLKAFLS